MVRGLDVDPEQALSAEQKQRLAALGGRTVCIGAPGSSAEVIDVEGTYAKWLNGIGAKYVVLRPDFYVAATCATEDDLRNNFDIVTSRLHLHNSAAQKAA